MYKIDARGLGCPKPVILLKKEIEKIDSGIVLIIVDNEIAKENVRKFAESKKMDYEIIKEGENFNIKVIKVNILGESEKNVKEEIVIIIGSNKMGEGDEELGKILIKSYFYALTEQEILPKSIIFINSGVYLTIETSSVLKYISELFENGVEIVSCGTCLEFYNIKDKVAVGNISNMYTIVELMNEAKKTIRI